MKKILSIAIVLAILVAGFLALQSVADGTVEASTSTTSSSTLDADGQAIPAIDIEAVKAADLTTDILPMDTIYGNPNAKIKLIEYASLSCSHCKTFHEQTLPEIKKDYVDSGKVAVIYRHYPLNLAALRAAQLVTCVDAQQTRKEFIDILFKTQADWAFSKNEEEFVKNLSKLWDVAGFDEESYAACIADKQTEEALLINHMRATKEMKVQSTPAIFINGEAYTESRRADALKAHLDSLL